MEDKTTLGGLDSVDNPAFPDITSELDPAFGADPPDSSGSSFPEIGSGFSSDPIGSSGSSFPEIGSGFDSGFGSGFPEITTDDFAQIRVDDTVAPPEVPAEQAFPETKRTDFMDHRADTVSGSPANPKSHEVTYDTYMDKDDRITPLGETERDTFRDEDPHGSGTADPVQPTAMPSIDEAAKKPVTAPPPPAEEDEFAGDHYVWNGSRYVETEEPSPSYIPPHQQNGRSYVQETSVHGNPSGQGTGGTVDASNQTEFTARVNSIKIMGLFAIITTFFGCFNMISIILAIATLSKASALNKERSRLTPSEENGLKSGKAMAWIALIFNGVVILFEGLFFLIPLLAEFSVLL